MSPLRAMYAKASATLAHGALAKAISHRCDRFKNFSLKAFPGHPMPGLLKTLHKNSSDMHHMHEIAKAPQKHHMHETQKALSNEASKIHHMHETRKAPSNEASKIHHMHETQKALSNEASKIHH